MNKKKLIKILDRFKNKKILVIGDVMLDKYIFGDVSRISPEAPIQIINVKKEKYTPGGAANVSNNINSLNGSSLSIGVKGDDEPGKILLSELKKRKIGTEGIITDSSRPTIQKIRVLGQNQQLLRIDYEKKEGINKDLQANIISYLNKAIKKVDAVIISDYVKGLLNKELAEKIIESSKQNKKLIIVDTRPKNIGFFSKVSLITPNHNEASEITHIEEETEKDILKIGNKLLKDLDSNVLITRGEKGMALFEKNKKTILIPTKAKEVYDVSGAGDTVTAALTLSLTSGATLKEAAIIANYTAGIVVGKTGTATTTIKEIKDIIKKD